MESSQSVKSGTVGTIVLMRGNTGKHVVALKKALRVALGEGAARFPGLSETADAFDADTETALRAWQTSVGLVADGIAGPRSAS